MNSITLYHTEWCPDCAPVRSRLDELEIEYKRVMVPTVRPFRKQDVLNHLDDLASG